MLVIGADVVEGAEDGAVVETTTLVTSLSAAWILNGNDHWKVLASESRIMAIP